jgi:hypothetical protein
VGLRFRCFDAGSFDYRSGTPRCGRQFLCGLTKDDRADLYVRATAYSLNFLHAQEYPRPAERKGNASATVIQAVKGSSRDERSAV